MLESVPPICLDEGFFGAVDMTLQSLEHVPVKLSFPNPSRGFDANRNCVRFWGYDRTIEVSFCVESGALSRLCPGAGRTEARWLKAFDEVRERIHEVADEVYVRGGRGKGAYAYVLSEKDI